MEALVHSLESPPNVICLTKTWLTENDDIDSLLVPGYNNYAIKKRNTLGGGVMIQIKDPIFLLETHSTDMDETLWSLFNTINIDLNWLLSTIHQEQIN